MVIEIDVLLYVNRFNIYDYGCKGKKKGRTSKRKFAFFSLKLYRKRFRLLHHDLADLSVLTNNDVQAALQAVEAYTV